MSADDRLIQTLFRLRDLSAEGKQAWERVPGREDPDFQTTIGSWTIEIQTVDGDGRAPYSLVIVNQDAEPIESITTTKSAPSTPQALREKRMERNIALRELYESARRIALGVNAALEEISQILGEDHN